MGVAGHSVNLCSEIGLKTLGQYCTGLISLAHSVSGCYSKYEGHKLL